MKVKRLFSVMGLGLFAAVAAGVGAFALKENKTEPVRAEKAASNVTQYVSVDRANWWTGGAEFVKIWMFGGDGEHPDKWVDTNHLGGNLYEFTFEAGYSQFVVAKASSSNNWLGQSYDIEYSSDYNTYDLYLKEAETKYSYDRYWTTDHNNGTTLTYYLDVGDQSYWHSDNAKIYLYCVGNGIDIRQMYRMGNSNVYYINTFDYYVFKFLFVRSAPAGFDGSDWSNSVVWNQTKDIIYTSTNENCRWVKLGSEDSTDNNKNNVSGFETVSVESFANAFSVQFSNTELCYDAGGLKEDFATKWTTLSDIASELNIKCNSATGTQMISGYLKTASSTGESNIAKAMKRYDVIRAKNPDDDINNFLQRALVPISGARENLYGTTSNSVNFVIIIAVISVSLVGCLTLVVFKRRKHN